MKRLVVLMAAVPMFGLVATAQSDPMLLQDQVVTQKAIELSKMEADLQKVVAESKMVGTAFGFMNSTVKGAPYSAVEVNESSQVLADGTRIHRENQTMVYRDGEGRVRRETPEQITIMDPVARTTYFLNPKNQTAVKSPLMTQHVFLKTTTGPGGSVQTTSETAVVSVKSNDGPVPVTIDIKGGDTVSMQGGNVAYERHVMVNGEPVDPATFDLAQEKMRQAKAARDNGDVMADKAALDKLKAEKLATAAAKASVRKEPPGESLGTQTIEGVQAQGTRSTETLDTGAIGNDRPIQIVNERWYSPDLQTMVMTRHSDPRSGDQIFKLVNITRGEPGADLFQVPTNYQITERK